MDATPHAASAALPAKRLPPVYPGAVVEFSGALSWEHPTSAVIRLRTLSRTSHLGIVCQITDDDMLRAAARHDIDQLPTPFPRFDGSFYSVPAPLIVESTTMANSPCLLQRKCVSGVQVHELAQRVAEYDGRVWLWNLSPDWRLNVEQTKLLSELALRRVGTQYDYEGALWAGSLFKWFFSRPIDLHQVYCNELVGALLERVGPLPSNTNVSDETPASLLRLLRHYARLDEPVRLK